MIMGIFQRIRELFMRKSQRSDSEAPQPFRKPPLYASLAGVLTFLQWDFEQQGYDDALTNFDEENRRLGLQAIATEVLELIRKAVVAYQRSIEEREALIDLAQRHGLSNKAALLTREKSILEREMNACLAIAEQIRNKGITTFKAGISYQQGFNHGVAAIIRSHRTVWHPLQPAGYSKSHGPDGSADEADDATTHVGGPTPEDEIQGDYEPGNNHDLTHIQTPKKRNI